MSLCLYSDGLEYFQHSILPFSRKMLNLKSALTISSKTVSGFGQIFQAVAHNFKDTVWNGRCLAPKIGRQV